MEQFLPHVLNHPLHRAMGVERIEASEGRSRIEIDVGPTMVNAAGMFLGGNVYTICDMACYAALLSELPEGENAVTHDIHVSLMRGARAGDRVVFTGRVIRRGRSVAFMEAEARCGEEIVARATVTKSILKPRS
ncbi:PaaI family thioesterase [Solimonas sp. K1W22B-7]|nr:PaaI family thioesterase [Solimonas sp. K1W22B-7]